MMTPNHASPATGLTKRLRRFAIVGGAAFMLAATAAHAAITPSNVDPWQHIVDCAGALFSNPAEHAQFCEPGPEPVDFKSNFMWTPVNPPPPPPPPSSSYEVPLEIVGD